jgi:hypothetical protein
MMWPASPPVRSWLCGRGRSHGCSPLLSLLSFQSVSALLSLSYLARTSFAEDATNAVGHRWLFGHVEYAHACLSVPIVDDLWLSAAWTEGDCRRQAEKAACCRLQAVDECASTRIVEVSSASLQIHASACASHALCCAQNSRHTQPQHSRGRQTERRGQAKEAWKRTSRSDRRRRASSAVCGSRVCWQLAGPASPLRSFVASNPRQHARESR